MNIQNFKIAFRRISANLKSNLMIFTGLVLGFTSCFVIYTKISYEMSFDRSHTQFRNIYRVVRVTSGLEYTNGGLEYRTGVHFPFPAEIKKSIPEISNVVSMLYASGQKVSVPRAEGEKPAEFILENGVVFTEPSFFDVFDYGHELKWISGRGSEVLNEPFTAVVTESIAELLYPGEDPSGKDISVFSTKFRIAGVVEDLPANSDFPFRIFISIKTFTEVFSPNSMNDWGSLTDNYQCYVVLSKGVSKAQVEAKFKEIYTPHAYDDYAERRLFKLQSLSHVHRESRFGNYNSRSVSTGLILALTITGIFIFLIASFNYSNFFIAETSKQNRQMALRLIMGGRPSMLFAQLLTESMIINGLALYTGLVIASEVIDRAYAFIDIPYKYSPGIGSLQILFLLLLLVTGSVLSVIFSFKNLKAESLSSLLKGSYKIKAADAGTFGRSSVVLQFIVAQVVIMTSLFILKQMTYMNKKDLGYSAENIICAGLPENSLSSMSALSNEILAVPGIEGVSFSSVAPARAQQWTQFSVPRNNELIKLDGEIKFIDTAYLNLYDFRIIAGRNFSSSDSSDLIIVNKEFLLESGYANAEESLGTAINGPQGRYYIAGVVDDFHSGSLRDEIRPCIFYNNPTAFRNINIKTSISRTGYSGIIERIQEKWKIIYPDEAFQYVFLEDFIASYYKSDRKTFNLFVLFSIITIFLCVLGVLGLSFSMNQKRIKETGLRRVNGATIKEIVYLLNRDFLTWIIIAFIISVPVSWYLVSIWLQNFAYKTGISWWVFILAGFVAAGIGLLTVTLQSYRAASANPVESLRND
ncbi:MAG TPA: ABC transporter permease [Bacteroidales bacterium]|nr:ABC transporter permease [Bacteroidales bacterium]